MGLSNVKLVELPKIVDPRGNLTFIEGEHHIPFPIKRVFYLYDVPGGESRAGHANKDEHFIIAASGSFNVVLDDGKVKKTYFLNRSYYGLYIPSLVWRELADFSSGSVCLVFSSKKYDPDDYYRDYTEFLEAVGVTP